MQDDRYKFSYKFPERGLTALTVYNTGVQRCEPGYSWGPGIRDHCLLHYVIAGKGQYEAFGRRFDVRAGELFASWPDETIYYRADDTEPWEYCWVGFNGADAPLLLEQTDLDREHPVWPAADGGVYKQMMQIVRAQAELTVPPEEPDAGCPRQKASGTAARGSLASQAVAMTGALYQLFALLIRDRRTPPRRSAAAAYVAEGCAYVASHYHLPVTVEDIAAHVGLSRSRLYRLFRQELQLSPMEYLAQYRVRQACALLERGDLSVKAVALSVGYEDQLYFSRRFRALAGMSPTAWAESHRR